jgi:hypothetical protein
MFVMNDEPSRRRGRWGETKSVTSFNWRRKERGQRDNMCQPCRAAYHHEHYLANKRGTLQPPLKASAVYGWRTQWLLEYFKAHPCSDCGETDPVVLEFDHLRDKAFDVAQALPYRNWAGILAEIEKCVVVCANCHRRRTAHRKRTGRATMTALKFAED